MLKATQVFSFNYNLLLFRSPEAINQELKRIEQYLKKIKEEHGEDWTDLQRKLDERQAGFDEVSSDLSILKMLIQVIKNTSSRFNPLQVLYASFPCEELLSDMIVVRVSLSEMSRNITEPTCPRSSFA